jgi:lipoate-protein ligase A
MLCILSLLSDSSEPLDINSRLFEQKIRFLHVFSFSLDCVSIGRNVKIISEDLNLPIFRRRTGGGAVFHGRMKDLCFAFTFESQKAVKDIFSGVGNMVGEFILNYFKLPSVEIKENGDVIFNGIKISGISSARSGKFFLFEGCILIFRDWKNLEIPHFLRAKFSSFCFNFWGQKMANLENFHKISFSLFSFLKQKILSS